MNKRILVIDDDDWQTDYIREQLEVEGYTVHTAPHALKALASVDSMVPDCVLLDIGLPGVNGVALLHELRSHADTAKIPVIVCSNLSVSLDELLPYGVTGVLQKSKLNHGDVVAAVRKALL